MVWTRGPTIGRGSSATVSLATTTIAGNLFAVKSTDLSYSEPLKRELLIMSQLDSPYIVKCLGSDITYEQNRHMYNLFLEYVPGRTLHDLILSEGGGSSLGEKSIRFYANQILKGLHYLHEKGIAHCDIKGQNILVGNNIDWIVKITDFGCAVMINGAESSYCKYRNGQTVPVISGTPAYMSPEAARGEEQSFPADIWALGCTIIEMATGRNNPWRDDLNKDPVSALYRIGYSNNVPEIPTWLSDTAKDFVRKCLVRDPKERWSAKQLLLHGFFDSLAEMDCYDGVSELTRKYSPTSVMDRGVWDDGTEVSSTCGSRDYSMDFDSGFDCFEDRIMGLIGECNEDFLDWEEDGDDNWVNVRRDFGVDDDVIDDIHENFDFEVVQDCDDPEMIKEEDMFLSFDEDELCVIEDLLFDFCIDEISGNDNKNNDFLVIYDYENENCKDEFVSRILIVLARINEFFLSIRSYFLLQASFFPLFFILELLHCFMINVSSSFYLNIDDIIHDTQKLVTIPLF